jgi:hypothetical protein
MFLCALPLTESEGCVGDLINIASILTFFTLLLEYVVDHFNEFKTKDGVDIVRRP